jgi:predicted outer membrane repeat protein
VQERDDVGNWSESASWETVVRKRVYVDGEGGDTQNAKSGDGSGSSWENAASSIGNALMSSETHYVDIWVKSGLYIESNWLYGGERLYGGFAGTESAIEERDLSGPPTIVTGSYGRAFTVGTGGTSLDLVVGSPLGTVIDGFTLASGTANYTPLPKQPGGDEGGALFFGGYPADAFKSLRLTDETPEPHRVANCVFSGNEAFLGGAIYSEGVDLDIENCVFSGNMAIAGGAIYSGMGTVACANSTFNGNEALDVGSAFYAAGSYNLTNCIFEGNRVECAIYNGLGLAKTDLIPDRIVRNCLFKNNCYADICDSGPPGQSYTGADEINAIPGASNNVDGDPLFATFGPGMLNGPIESSEYDYLTRLITITDSAASFAPGALTGRLLWLTPPVGEGEGEGELVEAIAEGEGEGECSTGEFMCLVILENTETSITALLPPIVQTPQKDLASLGLYLVLDYQLLPGSAAIDMGTGEGAPAADIVGGLRPIDIWGMGADDTGSEWDIGAYEADFLRVLSITRADPSPTNADQVMFDVLFSAPVTGVDAGDFALTPTGTLADFGVDLVSTDDNVLYAVTVDTGTGDGNLRLDLIDDDSISDGEGRFLGGEGEGNGDFLHGEEYVIDKTPPAPLDLAAAPRLAKLGTEVTITFGVSEPVATSAVTVNDHPATEVSGKNGGLTYTYTIQETDPDGCASIVVSLLDAAGNDSSTDVCDTAILEVDQTPPEFTGIVANPALAKEGAVVSIDFAASEPLDGDPLVTVNGHPAAMAPPKAGGYGFTYTVLAGDPEGPAEIVITGRDLAGNSGETTNNDALTVDKTPPAFIDFMAAPLIVKSGATVTITFDATEPLLDAPTVSLLGTTAAFVANSVGYTYSFLVPPGAPEGPVAVEIAGMDLAGNPGALLVENAFTVDNTPPEFIGISAQPSLAKEGTVVHVVFTATEPLDGDPLVTVNGHPATMDSGKGVGYMFSYTVLPDDPDGLAEIVITGQDLAGNPGEVTNNDALTIDKTPPAFTDIVANPALADVGRVVTITFVASETLQGGPQVMVNGYPAIQNFSKALGYQFTYTVQADTPDGPAEIVIGGLDLAGNMGETTNTDALTIDQTPPAFTGIVADPAAAERGTSVTLTFTASESLRFNPTVTVNGHAAAFASSSGLDYTYSYTVWPAEAFGAAEIVIVGQDLAGNMGTSVDTTALSIVDLVAPSISIGAPSVDATRGGPVTFLVTYGDDALGISLTEDDIELTGSGATAGVTLAETGPFTRLVTLSGIAGDGTLGIAIPAGTAADEYGNPAPEAASDLFDVDNTGPVITVLGENPVTVALNSEYTDAGATALDAREGNITESIDTVSDVDTSVEGDYTVTYDVADSLGNAAVQQVRTVHVVSLDECGSFAFPIDGSTITVAGGPDFWLVPILEADLEGAVRLEFFLDGVSIGEVETPPYSISYAMTAGETLVQYELTAQAYDAEDNVLCSSTITFNVIAAAQGEDGDENGLPDNPFTVLPDLGNTWFSQNVSGETGGTIVTAAATLHTCKSPAAPVVVTLVETDRRVTATAPAELFEECETAVVVFQMAPDLATLLGSVEAAVVLPEPDAGVLLGGMYYLCTVLVSNDEGATFEEIDPARLAANPVSLDIEGVAVPNDTVFYTHGIFADSDALTGVFIGGVPGAWDTAGLANIEIFTAALSVDVVKPSLFAPYTMKADDGNNPPAWPWLALLAAILGISLLGGGDDDGGGGPCFIATAAYGTPMAADVDTLRGLRDQYLLGSAAGTAFVDAYYRVSPAIAGVVSEHPALAAAIRLALVPVVLLSRALLMAPGAVALLALGLAWLALMRRRKARRST